MADIALMVPRAPTLDGAIEDINGLLALSSEPDGESAITLAGRRCLAIGNEIDGITEVWTHPARIMKNLTVSVTTAPAPKKARITPLFFERTLNTGVTERVLVPNDHAAIVWNWRAEDACELVLEWLVDLRFMSPYPSDLIGSLRWKLDERSLLVEAADTHDLAHYAASKPVSWEIREEDDAPELRVRVRTALAAGETFTFASAGNTAALKALANVGTLTRSAAGRWQKRSSELLQVRASDPRVEIALQWASHRLDRFVVDIPGVGRSLIAGYGVSEPGSDGRPSCASYLGNDSVWTAFAFLAIGDFEPVRDVIAFLGDKQDPRGKVLHECTPSGSANYDAADSTPLYLLLVARYLAASGDLHFVRGRWQQVLAALAYCRSTDSVADNVTFYHAGIRTAASRELVITAESIGERAEADRLRSEATHARQALEAQFFDADEGVYALKQKATHAVPLLLGAADIGRMSKWLDLVAGDAFTSPWGVRMIPTTDPDFEAASNHAGAVWPLCTGWTAWAEYCAGRTTSAFRHWWQNLSLCFERQKGAWDDLLHGTEHRSIGVCPDHAGSTAMAVSPLVYGLLGFEPDAAKNRARLRPSIPTEWDALEIDNLRVGDNTISLRYQRQDAFHRYRLSPGAGSVPLRIIFEPGLITRRFHAATVDGAAAGLDLRRAGDRLVCPLQIVLDHEREVVIHAD